MIFLRDDLALAIWSARQDVNDRLLVSACTMQLDEG